MSGLGGKSSIAAALADAGRELVAERRAAEGEQLALLPLPAERETQRAELEATLEARGRGRPKGAANRTTAEMRELVQRSMGGSAVENMARWARHDPDTLAIALGCSRADAFDRWLKLQTTIAEFVHGRAAPTDAAGKAVAPALSIVVGGGAGPAGAAVAPWLYLDAEPVESEQHQGVSEGPDPASKTAVVENGGMS